MSSLTSVTREAYLELLLYILAISSNEVDSPQNPDEMESIVTETLLNLQLVLCNILVL